MKSPAIRHAVSEFSAVRFVRSSRRFGLFSYAREVMFLAACMFGLFTAYQWLTSPASQPQHAAANAGSNAPLAPVRKICRYNEGRTIAVQRRKGDVSWHVAATGEELGSYRVQRSYIQDFAGAANAARLLLVSNDGAVTLVDHRGEPVWEDVIPRRTVSNIVGVALSDDGSQAFIADGTGEIRIWTMGSDSLNFQIRKMAKSLTCFGYHCLTNRVALFLEQSELVILDAASWEPVTTIVLHDAHVSTICFSNSGEYMAYGTTHRDLNLIETETGTSRLNVQYVDLVAIRDIEFSADDQKLIYGGFSGSAASLRWQRAGASPEIVSRHNATIESLAYNQNDREVLSVSSDGEFRRTRVH